MSFSTLAIPAVAAIGAGMATGGSKDNSSQGSAASGEKPVTPAWQPLQPGDMVAFVAPSHAGHKAAYGALGDTLREWGLQAVQQSDTVREPAYFEWPNTPERRADHIITALQDPGVKAIVALEGGEGANEVVEVLKKREAELNVLPRRAIPLIGYSDITQLQLYLGQKGLVSPVQGPSVEFLTQKEGMDAPQRAIIAGNQKALQDFLMGPQAKQPDIVLIPLNASAKTTPHIKGTLVGGGDISIGLTGHASYRLKTESTGGQILFLEGRSSASLRYALRSLKDRQQLGNADAIVLGRYYDNQQFSGDLKQAYVSEIKQVLRDMEITKPVYFGVPAGHTNSAHHVVPVIPLPLHTQAEISGNAEAATLSVGRFRDIGEAEYRRTLPQDLPPAPAANASSSPVVLMPIAFNELRMPDMDAAMQRNFKDKHVVLDFGDHAGITGMHMVLVALQGAGKLADAKSVILASSQPVPPEAQAWLQDFQQRHLPDLPMQVMQMDTRRLAAVSTAPAQAGVGPV